MSTNEFVPNKRQAITWANVELVYRRIDVCVSGVSSGLGVLTLIINWLANKRL